MNNVNLENMWKDYRKEKLRHRLHNACAIAKKCFKYLLDGYPYKIYSTKEVAIMLNVNEETVRRWCRSGELRAYQKAKKLGFVITEDNLKAFMIKHPKYKRPYIIEET